jgi:hypothetical protein
MSSGRAFLAGITRRKWAAIMAAAPSLSLVGADAQTPSTVPPQGVPPPPAAALTPEQKLQKAYANVHQASVRLSQIEIPMDVEPAFTFRV